MSSQLTEAISNKGEKVACCGFQSRETFCRILQNQISFRSFFLPNLVVPEVNVFIENFREYIV